MGLPRTHTIQPRNQQFRRMLVVASKTHRKQKSTHTLALRAIEDFQCARLQVHRGYEPRAQWLGAIAAHGDL